MMKFLASAFLSISFVLAPIAATAKSSPPYKGRVAGSSADGGVLANSKQRSDLAPSKKSWDRADKMLKKMSVDEKIGQLVHVGITKIFGGTSLITNSAASFFLERRYTKQRTSPTACKRRQRSRF